MTAKASCVKRQNKTKQEQLRKAIFKNWELYLFILPAALFVFVFNYIPIYGLQLAFKNMIPGQGIWSGEWVGFDHFLRFFRMYNFARVMKNTIVISVYSILAGFPIPIILALLFNQLGNKYYKRFAQTITLAPHFISMVVLVGLFYTMMKPDNGIINLIIDKLGGDKIYFFGEAKWGPSIYVLTGIWQESGWNAVIYLAALSSLDPKIMEAATIDGANRFQKVRYIELPTILPVISIMLIMSLGSIMNVGTGKMLLIRNSLNTSTTQVIGTYVYDISIANGQYEFGTAVSMFNTIINFSLLITVNWISGKLNGTTLF